MDKIFLILVKPLDKHGTTLVHITHPPLISVFIFAIFSEILTHVVGKNVFFLQFIAVKIPRQRFCNTTKKNKKQANRRKETLKRKRGRESLATCARNEVLT